MCINDGDLRAKLDGELAQADALAVEAHLRECERCRSRAEALAARASAVGTLFSQLAPGPGDVPADAGVALARLRARSRKPLIGLLPGRRWAWAAVAAVALVAVSVSSGPTRAFAQKILGLLRVKTVVVVPMDRDLVAEGKGKLLSNVLADSVTVTKEEKAQPAQDRAEAARLAGFTVRLPAMRSDTPQIVVEGERAFHFTANPKRLETLLSVAGRPDLTIPAGLENAKIAVDVPRSVRAIYGDCPQRMHGPQASPSNWATCLVVTQTPTPVVVTLPELDLGAIAELGLQLSGMSAEEARAFSRTVDWTSTLAIPLPRDAADYQTVTVDGVQGVLINNRNRGSLPVGYALIWIKDGIVYSLSGFGNPGLAVALAESLG